MKAVVARELGPPETMALEDIPSRALAEGEARVAVHYAGVSFVDVLLAAGDYQVRPPVPFVPGSEFSGVVIEVGPGVAHVAAGDRVAGAQFGGVLAEELIAPAAGLTRVAPGLGMGQAAVVRSSYLTACYALKSRAEIKPNERLLVLGAGGAVGIAAVQLGHHYGATVIASASTQEKRQLALANGADFAIDSKAEDWRDQLRALTEGKGVDVVIDPLGGAHSERALRSLAWKGRHIVIGFSAGDVPKLPTNLILLKGASVMGVEVRQFGIHEPEAAHAVGAEVTALMTAGIARPPIARIFPLDEFREAMQLAASGTSAGRVLLRMPAANEKD